MGHYHNKLDKKYFNKSIYVKTFEKAFDIKIKDYPLQYEILLDTYNTYIILNNTLFSLNYVPINQKVDSLIHTLNSYLNKYKNKIRKSYDSNCIMIYDNFEILLDELKEMKELHNTTNKSYNLKSIEKDIESYINILEYLNFDKLVDSKEMPYEKKANDKLPRKVNCKIIDNLEFKQNILFDKVKQEKLNNAFISKYYDRTNIDLNKDDKQREYIFLLHCIIKDLNNAIVDYYITNDITTLYILVCTSNFFTKDISFIQDIAYKTLFEKLKAISDDIMSGNIDIAYSKIKTLIEQYKELYEYMS